MSMKAQLIEHRTDIIEDPVPLSFRELPVPEPSNHQLLIRVSACGVCHTELDEIEGRIASLLPVVPGHQVIGYVEKAGSDVSQFEEGDRVGVAWIHSACGQCDYCTGGLENLCSKFKPTVKEVRHIFPDSQVYVFARDPAERSFARELGAAWVGEVNQDAPEPLRAIIDTTPAWVPVLKALENLAPGGRLVINAIRRKAATCPP